jgi:hypothetical protein
VGLLHGLRREPDVAEAEELARERRVVLRPQRLEDPQRLVGVTSARPERRAQDLMSRPSDSASMLASIFAITTGCRCPRMNTDEPSRGRVVQSAAAVSAVTGSR